MKKCFIIISCFLLISLGFAESPDIKGILESVKTRHPDYVSALLSAQAAQDSAQADRKEKVFSGSVSADGGVKGITGTESVVTPTAGSSVQAGLQAPAGARIQAGADYSVSFGEQLKTDNLGVSAAASIPVFVNGKFIDSSLTEAANFISIESPYVQAKTAAEQKQRSVIDAVIRLIFDTQTLSRKLLLAQRRLLLAEKEAEIARIQWESGNAGFSVYDKAQKVCDEARISVNELQNMCNAYVLSLSIAAGIENIDLSGISVPPQLSAGELQNLLGTPADLQISELQVKVSQMNTILAGAQYAPVLSVSMRAAFPNTFVKTEGLDSEPSWSASLSISIPLPAGVDKLRLESARLRQEAAVQEELSVRQNSRQQRQSLMNDYETACERELLREQILTQTRSRYKEVERAYETETATALDKERALLSVLEAESALQDEGISRFKAALSLYAYAGLDPENLINIK